MRINMNKVVSWLLLIMIMGHLLVGLVGCIFHFYDYRIYPYEKNTLWVSEDPALELEYIRDPEQGINADRLTWSGGSYDVNVIHDDGHFWIRCDFDLDKMLDIPQETLLMGSWEYEGENLVVEIREDNIFGGKLTKLTFEPRGTKLTRPVDYSDVVWIVMLTTGLGWVAVAIIAQIRYHRGERYIPPEDEKAYF